MEKSFNERWNSADYRKQAHEQCNKQNGKLAIIWLLYFVIMIIVFIIDSKTGYTKVLADGTVQITTWFQGLFNLLTSGAFAISFVEIGKMVNSSCNVAVEDLFYGFNDYKRTLLINLLASIFTFLWTLLLIVPGIIKSISYSMSFYIANDNKDLSASECIERSK